MNILKNKSVELARTIKDTASEFMDGTPRSNEVLKAIESIDRTIFLPEGFKHLGVLDESIAVGNNSTTSQPSLLAFMFDKLKIKPGDKVLEIGTGVGYAAALASSLCGESGRVTTVEVVPELVIKARKNLKGFTNISVMESDGSIGYKKNAPYDVIFLSAGIGPDFDCTPLLEQLSPQGKLMVPRRFGELYIFNKQRGLEPIETYFSVNFVPLTGSNSGWNRPNPG